MVSVLATNLIGREYQNQEGRKTYRGKKSNRLDDSAASRKTRLDSIRVGGFVSQAGGSHHSLHYRQYRNPTLPCHRLSGAIFRAHPGSVVEVAFPRPIYAGEIHAPPNSKEA